MCMQTKCSRKDVAPEKDVGNNNPPPPAPDSIIPLPLPSAHQNCVSFVICPDYIMYLSLESVTLFVSTSLIAIQHLKSNKLLSNALIKIIYFYKS